MNKIQPISAFQGKQWLGFDELSLLLNIDKDKVKQDWKFAGLGTKRFFNTIFSNYFKLLVNSDGKPQQINGRPIYVCYKDWACFTRGGKILVFEKGRTTDLASIPSWAFFFVNPNTSWIFWAAVVHDLRCDIKYPNKIVTDWEFFKDMRYFNAPFLSASIVFISVIIGNINWFKKNRIETEKQRIKNEIAFWKYVKYKNVPDSMIEVLEKEIKMMDR